MVSFCLCKLTVVMLMLALSSHLVLKSPASSYLWLGFVGCLHRGYHAAGEAWVWLVSTALV